MRITNYQLLEIENNFKRKFESDIQNYFKIKHYGKASNLIKEAEYFGFKEGDEIIAYIHFYLENTNLFEKKPNWLLFTLENNAFSIHSKLNHINEQINSIHNGQ